MGRWVDLTPQTSPWGWYCYHTHEWVVDHGDSSPCGVSAHYIRAVKLPAKKQAQKPARREPRVSRIATIIQRAKNGEFATVNEAAREVERLIDNEQRKKRHAKVKKPARKSAWRVLHEGEILQAGDQFRHRGVLGKGPWSPTFYVGRAVSGIFIGDYRRKVGAK